MAMSLSLEWSIVRRSASVVGLEYLLPDTQYCKGRLLVKPGWRGLPGTKAPTYLS